MIPNDLETVREALYDNDRAVSPVIGVILMVAITVILAAVIGTFVLGLGQDVGQSAPQASLSVSASSGGNITIEHTGGSALHADRTRIVVEVSGSNTGSDTYSPPSIDAVLSVGNDARIDYDGTAGATVDFNGNGTFHSGYGAGSLTIANGDTVSVQLIDTQTQRIIFESEVTAG